MWRAVAIHSRPDKSGTVTKVLHSTNQLQSTAGRGPQRPQSQFLLIFDLRKAGRRSRKTFSFGAAAEQFVFGADHYINQYPPAEGRGRFPA